MTGGGGGAAREHRIVDALTDVVGALARGDDVLELLELLTERCTELLDVTGAGLLLSDGRGELHVVAASSSDRHHLEALQAQRTGGPWRDCCLSGRPVLVDDLAEHVDRWPRFVPVALGAGWSSAHVVPVQPRSRTLGALGLFNAGTGALDGRDLALVQALADVASTALTRDLQHEDGATERVRAVLDGRVLVEQARGVLAHRGGLSTAQAPGALRRFGREHDLALSEVAGAVLTGTLAAAALLDDTDPDLTHRPDPRT